MLVKWYGKPYGLDDGTLAMVGLAAFLGHLYPVFFRFVGGKGVATALGVLMAVSAWLGLAILLTWVLVAYLFRYSSLSSLVAAIAAPIYYLIGDGTGWYMQKSTMLALVLMSALLVWRHAENLSRLFKGQESKLGAGPRKNPAAKSGNG